MGTESNISFYHLNKMKEINVEREEKLNFRYACKPIRMKNKTQEDYYPYKLKIITKRA